MKFTTVVTIFTTPKRTKAETLTFMFATIHEARIYAAGLFTGAEVLGKVAEWAIVENGRGIVEKGFSSGPLFDAIEASNSRNP